jgi:antitoxin YefM
MSTVPLAVARAQLSRMIDDAVRTHQRVEITRNGVRAAVLLAADDYDAMAETLDILSNTALVGQLTEAATQAARGEVYPLADIGPADLSRASRK